ncbi:MAG: SpoIID/LytB domain-containing protein [Oscillospiraceae bacterium]|nr:SpoIID/LytB domain-containing protein [Oscillospiraceae bacterium]
MKKFAFLFGIIFIMCALCCTSAFAVTNGIIKVGLYYNGSSTFPALLAANLENYSGTGSGYSFGYYDSDRAFHVVGQTTQTKISMCEDVNLYVNSASTYTETANGGSAIGCFHFRLSKTYSDFASALAEAETLKSTYGTAFPAYKSGTYYVLVGSYTSSADASAALSSSGLDASVDGGSGDTVTVVATGTTDIIFEYDCGGESYLAVEPMLVSASVAPQTWFKGYRYYGGFEYRRITGGAIQVINVLSLEDYVKGVVVYEMSASWPEEALKAQSVCARSYAMHQTKHCALGFDVCATTDCQVYRGTSASTAASDACVDATAGQCIYYKGNIAETVFFSSDGGATESAVNVWGSSVGCLIGAIDTNEDTLSNYGVTIPNYSYSTPYTPIVLGALLTSKGYTIGSVSRISVTPTATGNMGPATFYDSSGNSVTVSSTKARSVFSTRSQRFMWSSDNVSSASSDGIYVNNSSTALPSLSSAYTISGSGTVAQYGNDTAYVVTSSGIETIGGTAAAASSFPTTAYVVTGSTFTLSGRGSGHNVGLSQYGAYAMAKAGKTYSDILHYYYTDVTIG